MQFYGILSAIIGLVFIVVGITFSEVHKDKPEFWYLIAVLGVLFALIGGIAHELGVRLDKLDNLSSKKD